MSENDSQGEESEETSEENSSEEKTEEGYDEESDDEGWVTSDNILELKRAADGNRLEDKYVTVGCLSTDFSIQVRGLKISGEL